MDTEVLQRSHQQNSTFTLGVCCFLFLSFADLRLTFFFLPFLYFTVWNPLEITCTLSLMLTWTTEQRLDSGR
jgi:hypothetical protein